MKITYVHHSSFMVETESACLLFDYFEGELPMIPAGKPLYVLSSHCHGDHFSDVIFELAKTHDHVRYILSFDILPKRVPEALRDCTSFVNPYETWKDDILTVETYRSTDEGVAFWCKVDGKTIYHAGDLNHWYWEGEDEQWNRDMTAAYRAEIEKMRGRKADAAFLPLDPRLEQWFYLGIDDFMKEVDADVIVPMHFWGRFDAAQKLKELECSKPYRDKVVEISKKGQTFTV